MPSSAEIRVMVQAEDFDLSAEIERLTNGRSNTGAIVTFTGLCRDEEGTLSALELEHYPGMAEAEMVRIAQDACNRWPVHAMTVIHRYGHIKPGENIVLVIAASKHRQAAFDGANFMMDFLKTQAPFWKKEHLKDGATGHWVDAREADDEARERWQ